MSYYSWFIHISLRYSFYNGSHTSLATGKPKRSKAKLPAANNNCPLNCFSDGWRTLCSYVLLKFVAALMAVAEERLVT